MLRVLIPYLPELLTKSGLSGVSVDEVSRRSGVAKTTIYRHWPSREALLLDACAQASSIKPQDPDTGSLKGDLELLARDIAARLEQPWSSVLPSIIDAAERDKELASLQSRIHAQTREAFDRHRAAQEPGELPRSQDPREFVALIFGPLLYRRFFSREGLDEGFAQRVVERALRKAN